MDHCNGTAYPTPAATKLRKITLYFSFSRTAVIIAIAALSLLPLPLLYK